MPIPITIPPRNWLLAVFALMLVVVAAGLPAVR